MGTWTLVVQPDVELRKEIGYVVQDVLNSWAGNVVLASNAEGARGALFEHGVGDCRLIITGVALPRDAATSLVESGDALGLQLVRLARQHDPGIPVVFTDKGGDVALGQEVARLAPSQFVQLGRNWGETLPRALSELRNGAVTRRSQALDIDMALLNHWNWWLNGPGVEDAGEIYVDPSALESVQDWSRALSRDYSGQTWETSLNSIRKALNDLFFRPTMNQNLNNGLLRNIGKFGAANARVRFIVNDSSHELLLEALQDPENNQPSYWMLKAPIYRRYDRPGMGYPLFKDGASRDGTINCLIVAADPRGCDLGDPWNTPLEELSKLLDEVKTVEAILQREKTERGGIGEVRLFEAGKHPDPAGELTKLLQKGPWHLVHFAGHAVRSGAAGALVLGGERGAVLPIGNLAEQLAEAGTQFLYLSSCRSADAYFVMRLVEQRLPAVLGFRWPVNDPKAMEYARRFYEALFEKESSRKYLEYAFLSAKRELHRMCEAEQKPDSTWAAPVLVMQVNQKGLPAVPGRQGSVEDGPRATLH